MVKVIIEKDSGNPEIKVMSFQHNGITKIVPLGEITKVPEWVVDNNPEIFTGENPKGKVIG